LIATLIAGLAYGLFALIAQAVTRGALAVTIPTALPRSTRSGESRGRRALLALASLALPFALWWALLLALHVPSLIAKTPADLVNYLFLSPQSAMAQSRLLHALAATIPDTFIGMIAGLAFAFLLALGTQIVPSIVRAFMPVALVTQTMPLVALTPLLVLILGRGEGVILWITISVTFFPAFVTIAQGLLLVPPAALDLPRAYGASVWKQMRLVSIPASLPYLLAAARLTVPRALLGVMIAEWLATGTGLGNLLNQSRGYMDYGMIWTVAVTSVIISVALYQLVGVAERLLLRTR
jgi:ABC-type nitrate/sulfonate/bicarbonate transport system permease component